MDDNSETCRICTGDEYSLEDPLIEPCNCSGSIKWVHKSCLDHWRSVNRTNFSKCDICKYNYQTKDIEVTKSMYYKQYLRYCLFMTRDISIAILVWLSISYMLGYISYKYDWFNYIYIAIGRDANIYLYNFIFGNLIACFITGVISIIAMVIMIIVALNDGNGGGGPNGLGRVFDNSWSSSNSSSNKTNSTKTSDNRKTDDCACCLILIGICVVCFAAIYFVGYLAKKHSDRTWRKELTKTTVIVPKNAKPDKYEV